MTKTPAERAHVFPGIELELPVLSMHAHAGPAQDRNENSVQIEPTVEALLEWLGELGPVSFNPVPLTHRTTSDQHLDDVLEPPLPTVDEVAEINSRGIPNGFGTVTGTIRILLKRQRHFGVGEIIGGRAADLEKVWFDRWMYVAFLKASLSDPVAIMLETPEGACVDGTDVVPGELMHRMTDLAETIARVEESCPEIRTGNVPSRRIARLINQRPNRHEIIDLLDEGVTLGRKIESASEALLDCRIQPQWSHPDSVLIETSKVFNTVVGARKWLEGTINALDKWNRR